MRAAVTTVVILVAAATLAGDARDPQPYLLRHQGRPDNPVVVGAVYTPYVRAAFIAKAADEGRRLAPDADLVSTTPLVYIAFRWYCCDAPDNAALAAAEPKVVMLPVAPRAPEYVRFSLRDAVPPVWSRKGTASLDAFGAPPPFDDVVLVAAFPADALRPGRPFAIYKEDAGRSRSIRMGVIRADDAALWR